MAPATGWKLPLVTMVPHVWLALGAKLTPATIAGNEQAFSLLPQLPPDVRFLCAW